MLCYEVRKNDILLNKETFPPNASSYFKLRYIFFYQNPSAIDFQISVHTTQDMPKFR